MSCSPELPALSLFESVQLADLQLAGCARELFDAEGLASALNTVYTQRCSELRSKQAGLARTQHGAHEIARCARCGPTERRGMHTASNPLWSLPGLDRESFYAFATLLHISANGQLRLRDDHKAPQTVDIKIRNFLDCLADCFARSKATNAQSHVSAAAMVLDEKKQRKIHIFVAKNISGQNMNSQADTGFNEDESFAQSLAAWFCEISSRDKDGNGAGKLPVDVQPIDGSVWDTMYTYNKSRLEYYANNIKRWSNTIPPNHVLYKITLPVIRACKSIGEAGSMDSLQALGECARVASVCRSEPIFQQHIQNGNHSLQDKEEGQDTKEVVNLIKWISYLGRLGASYKTFIEFCTEETRLGFTYEITVLKSPDEEEWKVDDYLRKIESWSEAVGLDEEKHDQRTIRDALSDFANTSGSRGTARVHCEMQLLDYFTQPGVEKCLDYIGCSKKSCWLCWQFMRHFGNFTTKGTHRMIYPMWALPRCSSREAQKSFLRALTATYDDMRQLIQDKTLYGKAFSLQPNLTHTSFRMDRFDSFGSGLSLLPSTATGGLLDTTLMVEQGRESLARLAVLHLPGALKGQSAADLQPRVVYVDIYERWWFDQQENAMQAFRLGDKEVVFPFQLNTKVLADDELGEINLIEAEGMFWCISPEGHNSKVWYVPMSRVDDERLDPNPWLSGMLRSKGENFNRASLPWFGDVFVIPTQYDPEGGWIDISLDPDALNMAECESILAASMLRSYEGTVWYAALRHGHNTHIKKALERNNSRAQMRILNS
jgi:hypothetical protein